MLACGFVVYHKCVTTKTLTVKQKQTRHGPKHNSKINHVYYLFSNRLYICDGSVHITAFHKIKKLNI